MVAIINEPRATAINCTKRNQIKKYILKRKRYVKWLFRAWNLLEIILNLKFYYVNCLIFADG